jgi:hypothetical protein
LNEVKNQIVKSSQKKTIKDTLFSRNNKNLEREENYININITKTRLLSHNTTKDDV